MRFDVSDGFVDILVKIYSRGACDFVIERRIEARDIHFKGTDCPAGCDIHSHEQADAECNPDHGQDSQKPFCLHGPEHNALYKLEKSHDKSAPSSILMILSAYAAIAWFCVARTTVFPFFLATFLISSATDAPIWLSKFPVGSSARMIRGS